MLRPATLEPVKCAPAILANTLALCRDVAVYPTGEEPPFREVHAELDLRVRVSACTDYLTALLDPTLSGDLRSRASSLAEELLQDEPVRRQIERIFLSVAPPDDADLAGARELGRFHLRTGLLLTGLDRAALLVGPLETLWEEEKARLSSLADRASADALFRQGCLIAEALKGADLETLTMDAAPPVRDAFTRWAVVARELVTPDDMTLRIEQALAIHETLVKDVPPAEEASIRWSVQVIQSALRDKPARVLKTKQIAVQPLSIEEAALRLDDSKNDFIVFRNLDTSKVSVMYRRDDDDTYRLIAPAE